MTVSQGNEWGGVFIVCVWDKWLPGRVAEVRYCDGRENITYIL